MTVQEQALKAYYASITDGELLKLAANRSSFIEPAQEAMAQELASRHLAPQAVPASENAEPPHRAWLANRLAHVFAGHRK